MLLTRTSFPCEASGLFRVRPCRPPREGDVLHAPSRRFRAPVEFGVPEIRRLKDLTIILIINRAIPDNSKILSCHYLSKLLLS